MNTIFNGIRRFYYLFSLSYGLIVILTIFGYTDIFSNYLTFLDISYFLITILAIYRQFRYKKQLTILLEGKEERYASYADAFFFTGSFVLLFYYFLIAFFNPYSFNKGGIDHTTIVVINDFEINMGLFAIAFAALWFITMTGIPKQLILHSNIEVTVKPLMSTKMLLFPPVIDEGITLPEGTGMIPGNLRILAVFAFILYSAMIGFWVLLKFDYI